MRLLFFTPSCERTGAEIALRRLLARVDREKIQMSVAYGSAGPLSSAFPRNVPVFDYGKGVSLGYRSLNSLYHRAHRVFYEAMPDVRVSPVEKTVRLIHARVGPDLWYVNTIIQPKILKLARKLDVPCILHSYELEGAMETLSSEDVDNLVTYPRLVIADSRATANMMRVLGRVNDLEICHAPIDINEVKSDAQTRALLRKQLNIDERAFVWTMSGTRTVNKNPVMFVRLADALRRDNENVHFLWVGGEDNGYAVFARRLAEQLGVAGKMTWIAARSADYFDYLNVADALMLTSTQESLSLVALEMAALGKPIVSFRSGGPSEVVTDGLGVLVDLWNVDGCVSAMRGVMRGDVHLDAGAARRRAAEFDVSSIVKRWERLVERYAPR